MANQLPREVVEDLELDTLRVYVMSVSRNVKGETMSELVSEFWSVQREPGSVADQLIKKGETRGEARGIRIVDPETIQRIGAGKSRQTKDVRRKMVKQAELIFRLSFFVSFQRVCQFAVSNFLVWDIEDRAGWVL
jgi:hypothetical protein